MLEIRRTDEFAKWLKKLKDANSKAKRFNKEYEQDEGKEEGEDDDSKGNQGE